MTDQTPPPRSEQPPSLEQLAERIQSLEASKPKKDLWDKLTSLSGIMSGVLVAVIGFYATQIYDNRSREIDREDRNRNVIAAELQTVEKFFPHLASTIQVERQGAIEAISSLGNPQLATRMAKVFGGPGAVQALTNIASTLPTDQKRYIELAISELLQQVKRSIVKINIIPSNYQETGFLISTTSDIGYVLTTAHSIDEKLQGFKIIAHIGSGDGPPLEASLIKKDNALDLALLSLPQVGEKYVAAKIGLSSFQVGDKITVMGFPVDFGLTVLTGTIVSNDAQGRILADINVTSGTGGSPIFNSAGEIIGVISGRYDSGPALGVPIEFARPILESVGVQIKKS